MRAIPTPRYATIAATFFALLLGSAHAQLPGDSHWFYEYGGPASEPFGVEFAGDYAYIFGGFLNVNGDTNMKNLTRFHLKRERYERVPGIDSNFRNFIVDAYNDNQGNLFICGDFSEIDGITAKRVARFDLETETWHNLEDTTLPDEDRYGPSGGGADAVIRSGDYVYIGGFLFDAPDTNRGLKFIRRYNLVTERWESVGKGLNDTVRAFTVDSQGRVYAGGSFTANGDDSTAMANVAVWNGTRWQAIDGGVNGDVRALDINKEGYLAVGGQFSSAGSGGGSVACNNIALWKNGVGWDNADGGITPEAGEAVFGIYGLSWSSDGLLYVGGDFSFDATGTVDLNKVAYYENDEWKPMGSGLGRSSSQIVNDVDTLGCEAFCVGVFARGWTSPNSQPNFARWDRNRSSDGHVIGMPFVNCTLTIERAPSNLDQVLIRHGSNIGQSYVVEANSDLKGPWTVISAPFTATSENGVVWTINSSTSARGYFRIVGSN